MTANGATVTLRVRSARPVSVVVVRATWMVHDIGSDVYCAVCARRAVIVAVPTDTTEMTPVLAFITPATLGVSLSYVNAPLLALVADTMKYSSP